MEEDTTDAAFLDRLTVGTTFSNSAPLSRLLHVAGIPRRGGGVAVTASAGGLVQPASGAQ